MNRDRTDAEKALRRSTNNMATLASMTNTLELEASQHDIVRERARRFARDICDSANTRLYRPALTVDVVADAKETLYRNGHHTTTDDEQPVQCATHPERFHELLNNAAECMRFERNDTPTDTAEVHRIKVKADASMPKDKAVFVHEEATVPNRHLSDYRPWLVRDNRGVVTAVIHG